MFDLSVSNHGKALQDIVGGIAAWRLWHLLAWQEIKQRYRRSTLGPFWMTLSMAVTIATMGLVVTWLFGHDIERFLPYLCISIILWAMITGIINDGANCFIGATGYISQMRRPFTLYILQAIWRNIITLGHNMVVFVAVSLIFLVPPKWTLLILIVTFPLVLLSLSWLALILAVLSARFRDVPIMVQNAFAVLFWLTPVIYYPDQLSGLKKLLIVDINPLAHMLALVRAPLLGAMPEPLDWAVTVGVAAGGWIFAFLFFARFRARIPYWL